MWRERVLKRKKCQGKEFSRETDVKGKTWKAKKTARKRKVKIETFARQVCSFLLKVLVCKALWMEAWPFLNGGSKFPAHDGLLNQGAVVEAQKMCRGHSKWPRVVRSNASLAAAMTDDGYPQLPRLCMFMSDFNTMSPCLFLGVPIKGGPCPPNSLH